MFAKHHEEGIFVSRDRFLKQIMRREGNLGRMGGRTGRAGRKSRSRKRDIGLLEGKVKREELQGELFMYLNSIE
jgi:hypothetical protein